MRHSSFGCLVVSLVVLAWLSPAVAAQEKSARGSVTAVANDSLTVKAGMNELKLMVDPKTVLIASGAGTAERRSEQTGKPGPRLTDFVKVGDSVEVSYREMGGMMHASEVRRVRSAGSGGGSTSDERTEIANGTVESLSGSTLTITGSASGGAEFKQSFTVDASTRVVAVGAGTASADTRGKIAIADVVGVGDEVRVTYQKKGDMLHANEVRVTRKKS